MPHLRFMALGIGNQTCSVSGARVTGTSSKYLMEVNKHVFSYGPVLSHSVYIYIYIYLYIHTHTGVIIG